MRLTVATVILTEITCTGQSQLSADNTCVSEVPEVIAHCALGIVEAHLYTSLQLCVSSHQPQLTIITIYD